MQIAKLSGDQHLKAKAHFQLGLKNGKAIIMSDEVLNGERPERGIKSAGAPTLECTLPRNRSSFQRISHFLGSGGGRGVLLSKYRPFAVGL